MTTLPVPDAVLAAHTGRDSDPEAPPYAITVYRYGLSAPLDWRHDCERQMLLMRDLWNVLVRIEARYRERYEAVVRSPSVAAIEADLAAQDAAAAEWRAKWQALKGLPRRRKDQEAAAALAAALAGLHEARGAQRAARARLKAARATERGQRSEAMAAIEQQRRAEVTEARQAANGAGCWWSNANAVIASYQRMRGRLMREGKHFVERRGAMNRIVNQIQGGMSVPDLCTGRHSQVRLDLSGLPAASRRQRRWRRLTATVYCGRDDEGRHIRRTVTWPCIVSHGRDLADLPPTARIQEVHIVRQRNHAGGRRDRYSWSVSFLLRVPSALPTAAANAACGIDIGWRLIETAAGRAIRVATVASTADDPSFSVTLPPRFLRDQDRVEELATRRAADLASALDLVRGVPWQDAPESLRIVVTAVLGMEMSRAAHLMPLATAWQALPDWRPRDREAFLEWRRGDKRNWQEWEGLLRNIGARRREIYHVAIKRIVERHGLIGIEDVGVGDMIRSMRREGADPALKATGRVRQLAAPGEFLALLDRVAQREGVRVHRHRGKSTGVCPGCGAEFAPRDRAAVHYTCPHCTHGFDQDVGAARALLAAALAANAPAVSDGAAALAAWNANSINHVATEQPAQ